MMEKHINKILWIVAISFMLIAGCASAFGQINFTLKRVTLDSVNARIANIHMNDSVIFHSGTNLVGFWNRDSTYLYINDSNIVKMSDTILIIATKSDLHDNIYALEGVIKDGDTIKLGGEYTNNIDIYSDSLRGFKIRNSNSLLDFNYDITDGITLSSYSKDYNTSSELFMDTLGWYTYFLVVGDSVTEMIADTGGLRYYSEYYWKDQTDPLWIPPKTYVDSVAQLRYISIDISSADILAGNEVTLISAPGAGKSIFPQSMVFSTPDGTAYTGGGNNVLELGGMVEKIYTSEALDLDSQYQSYYYTTPFYETQTANGTPENKALTLDLYTHSTGNKTLNVQIWYTILKH